MTRIYESRFKSVISLHSFIYVYEHLLPDDIKRELFGDDHNITRRHIYICSQIKRIYRRLTQRGIKPDTVCLSNESYFYHLDASWRYI